MKLLLLGAGYATRLYPLTKDRPKPLLPVNGRPMLEWILDRTAPIDAIDRGYLVTNHRFAGHYAHWLANCPSSVPIEIVDDGTTSNDDKLGAVGDIDFVLRKAEIDDDLLIVAGDNLFETDLDRFVSFFREKKAPVIALRDMKDSPLINRYSVVTLDDTDRIVDFEEKPPFPKTSLISICLYLFPRDSLPLVRRYLDEGNNPDAPGYYIQWLVKQIPTYGWVFDEPWFDIGDIDSYNEANRVYGSRERGGRA